MTTRDDFFKVTALMLLFCVNGLLQAQNTKDDVIKNLDKMPRPWQLVTDSRPAAEKDYSHWRWIKRIPVFSMDQYSKTLQLWAKKYNTFSYSEKGKNKEGYPIYLIKITDPQVPDKLKNTVLITTLDSGSEKSGPTTAMKFIEWVLSNNDDAAVTRRNHVILLMPVMNPYGFFKKTSKTNSDGVDIYSGNRGAVWNIVNTMTLKEQSNAPELQIMTEVINEYNPEVHVDLHGIDLNYGGMIMKESTGIANSNPALRCWDSQMIAQINQAGEKFGYSYCQVDNDPQQLCAGSELVALKNYFKIRHSMLYSPLYGYCRAHTMPVLLEIAWEESGVERLKGLFRIGNRAEPDFPQGYPVNTLKWLYGGYAVNAYGLDPAAKRNSRIEIWQKQPVIFIGHIYPLFEGREMFFCVIGKKGLSELFANAKPGNLIRDRQAILNNLKKVEYINMETVEQFLRLGPENMFWFDIPDTLPINDVENLKNGLQLSFTIPYIKQPEILEIRLNGILLKDNPVSGYEIIKTSCKLIVVVNIPPEQASKQNLFIVTCGYCPDQQRTLGWSPPAEIK